METAKRSMRPSPAIRTICLAAALVAQSTQINAIADIKVNVGRGDILVNVPPDYDDAFETPLIILLHGYSSSGPAQESYMKFTPLSDEYGFFYAYPNGLTDSFGYRFWNATDACCDFFDRKPDDSGYLLDLVDAIREKLNVDTRRIYFIGHSNGGFMSYRMACDHSDVVAGIASLAGATWLDPANCDPTAPVHVLQIHGTSDNTIIYAGGCLAGDDRCYPGAIESVEQWATFDGCTLDSSKEQGVLDLDSGITGKETDITHYETACDLGGLGELWTIKRGGHSPRLSKGFSRLVVEWLLTHPKPPPVSRGDMNCDDAVNFDDIDPFVTALSDRAGWEVEYPDCNFFNADINQDDAVDFNDIGGFVECLINSGCE